MRYMHILLEVRHAIQKAILRGESRGESCVRFDRRDSEFAIQFAVTY